MERKHIFLIFVAIILLMLVIVYFSGVIQDILIKTIISAILAILFIATIIWDLFKKE